MLAQPVTGNCYYEFDNSSVKKLPNSGKSMDQHMRDIIATFSVSTELTPEVLRRLRRRKGESQEKFWGRFAVTQSSGSRFEVGGTLPPTLALMIRLYIDRELTDKVLDKYTTQ